MTKKSMIQKSDNEIGKFWNRKTNTYRPTGPVYLHGRTPDITPGKWIEQLTDLETQATFCKKKYSYDCYLTLWSKRACNRVLLDRLWLQQQQYCASETRFRYREPKPRSNFGIGIGAEIFFSRTKHFPFFKIFKIFLCFPVFSGGISFIKLKIEYLSSKII